MEVKRSFRDGFGYCWQLRDYLSDNKKIPIVDIFGTPTTVTLGIVESRKRMTYFNVLSFEI